jgi:maltoporin
MTRQTLQPSALFKLASVAAALMAAGAAQAVDFSGYLRAGPAAASRDGVARECYGLGGIKYRLGNECDTGGEFTLSQGFKLDGVDARASLMLDHWSDRTAPNTTSQGGCGDHERRVHRHRHRPQRHLLRRQDARAPR